MNAFLLILSVLIALFWLALAIRFLWIIAQTPSARPESASSLAEHPRVAVVVAAHNEERDIDDTAATLIAQDYDNMSITIVDDQSNDRTGSILDAWAGKPAARDRLKILHGEERPLGWVGKTWAVDQGTKASDPAAVWYWFVDGDMRLDPRALSTALAVASRSNADLVSFLPAVRCETFWQSTISISLGMILTHVFAFPHVNDPRRVDAVAAGGFLLVKKSLYDQVGGHESVRSEIVEDIELARAIKGAGGRLVVGPGLELSSTHAYGTFGQIWSGLRKNAYAGMKYQFHQYLTGVFVALTVAWVPFIALISGCIQGDNRLIAAGVLGWLMQAFAVAPLVFGLKLRPWHLFCVPLGMTLYVAIATSSVWDHSRGRVLWKDRVFAAHPPGPGL